MGFFNSFFEPIFAVNPLSKADKVAANVPQTAIYVTIGPVMLFLDAIDLNGGEAGWEADGKLFGRGNGRDFGYISEKDGIKQQLCYLVLDGDMLRAITDTGEYFSVNAHEIKAIDARYEGSSFLLIMKDGCGLGIGAQTPVEIPPGFQFTTVRGVTNKLSGWDKFLGPYGVKVSF